MKIIKKYSKKQLFLLTFVLVTVVYLNYYNIQRIKKNTAQVKEQARLKYEGEGRELIRLVKYGTLEQVKKAIQEGADINYFESYRSHTPYIRYTPVVSAVLREDLPLVKWLVEHGANIHQKINDISLMVYAVKQSNREILVYLLEQGIDPNDSKLALDTAIYNNQLDYVKLLFTHGFKLKNPYYALLYSVMLPDSEITQYLLAQGRTHN